MVQMASLSVAPLAETFDEVLGGSVHLKVVGLLVTLPEKEFTGREIASLLHVSHSNVQRALRVLADCGFLSLKRVGRADVARANKDHFTFAPLRALFQVKRDLAERVAEDLRSGLRESAASATVFGSFARGQADRSSDLDVLVIVKGRAIPDERVAFTEAAFARKYGVSLSVHLLSSADLRGGRVPAYARTASEEGVHLLGIPLRQVMDSAR